jgi:dolichol-phosphate mannosyltransferase
MDETIVLNKELIELPDPWRSSAVTVVLPTYNEARNLPIIVGALFNLPLPSLRVLVVDDNSADGTGQIAEGLSEKFGPNRLTVVHRPGKQGLGRAYIDGMTHALAMDSQFVVQMDSDLSHAPEYLPQMLGTLLSTNAAVVIGSRYVTGASLAEEWGWHRRLLSRWATLYVQTLLRMRVRDVTAGFKLWRRTALEAIDLASVRSNGYSFQVEMNYRAVKLGLKIVELPIHFSDRKEGVSKMSLKVQIESALAPFRLRWLNR